MFCNISDWLSTGSYKQQWKPHLHHQWGTQQWSKHLFNPAELCVAEYSVYQPGCQSVWQDLLSERISNEWRPAEVQLRRTQVAGEGGAICLTVLWTLLGHKKGYYKEPQLCDECRIWSEVTNDSSSKTAIPPGGMCFTACGTFLSHKKISSFANDNSRYIRVTLLMETPNPLLNVHEAAVLVMISGIIPHPGRHLQLRVRKC